MLTEENRELERYLNAVIKEDGGKTIVDWKRIYDYTISSDSVCAQMGKRANQTLFFIGKLADMQKDGIWRFSEEKMNPLGYIVSIPEKVGRLGFVEKEDIIKYGEEVWSHRLDNWTITNGKEVIARRDIY